ncbi:hypothetical protein AGDE_10784 [Angomonas deanei]|uniref:Uncharacterized protein n=1 Tax=Angomonas deanei TaxID=59799 RepID=A0A7G2CVW5_9TRYP|nr:hypothetical protein AGDE_10784 [Angomonas deanei]CAD2222462.1 hypothetical protein, conserved [Angomonas deanei]|eukprot:EPY27401.1 hypothetical protein AGDE_10784 [Angomonas deanei]
MTLKASCDALYFPDTPRDNIIQLTWEKGSTPLESLSLLIYKAKCTAPHLFHVLPRYGAILLTTANGAALPGTGTISFGLREPQSTHAEGNSAVTATPSNSGTKKYQERFALEYLVIHSETAAHQQISQVGGDPTRTSEVVKSIWSMVTSRTIPSSHVGAKGGVNLKVYMQNVVLSTESPRPGCIIVPDTAQLVSPSLQDRLSGDRSPNSAAHYSPTASSHRGSVGGTSAATIENELRALREEITTLKAETTPSRSVADSNSPASVSESGTPLAMRSLVQGGFGGGDSRIMDYPFPVASGTPKKKSGLKLSRLLLIMLVFYILCVLLFRTSAKTKLAREAKAEKDAANRKLNSKDVNDHREVPSTTDEPTKGKTPTTTRDRANRSLTKKRKKKE